MSFLRHRQTHLSDLRVVGATLFGAPTLIVVMSLQLAIPWWVALQQSPLPLHQLGANLIERMAVLQRIVSGTFLREATNGLSGTFLREATGKHSRAPSTITGGASVVLGEAAQSPKCVHTTMH